MLHRILLAGRGGSFVIPPMSTASGLVYNSATQTIAHDTHTQFNLNSVQSDPHGYWVNTTTLTVPAGFGGDHLFLGSTWASGTVDADIHIFFRVNGDTAGPRMSRHLVQPGGPDLGYMQVFAWLTLADGDDVSFWAYVDNPSGSKTFGHATIIDAQTAMAWFKIT